MHQNDMMNYWLQQQAKDQKKTPLPRRFYDERKRASPKSYYHVYENVGRERRQGEQLEAIRRNLTPEIAEAKV